MDGHSSRLHLERHLPVVAADPLLAMMIRRRRIVLCGFIWSIEQVLRQLAEALESALPVIVTTMQKFSFIPPAAG